MKYSNLFSLLIFLLVYQVKAQSDFYSEGFEVTKSDIEQTVFSKDSTANALVIYEVGDSFVDEATFKLNTVIKRKLKILNQDGFKHGTLVIYLYKGEKGKKQKVNSIIGTVYNIENGEVKRTQLQNGSIFEESYNDNYDLVKVVFPNVKEGTVIHYSYTLESPFMFKYKGWNFQEDIPKLYSEYNASIPGNWEYNIKLVGGQQLTTNYATLKQNCLAINSKVYSNCGIYKYVMKDIPAFINEDYMTTRSNYLARIEYELKTFKSFTGEVDNITKSWKFTDKEIEKNTDLGRQLKKTNAVKDLVDAHIASESDALKKTQAIWKYVIDNYSWNEQFKVLENISIKDVINNKSGNVGEINALLYNLLIAHDIEAKPLLLSTRGNGFITKIYPVLSDFNYLVVKVDIDGKTYLLDATEDYLSFGQIPFRCLNQYGRLLDFDNESEWYDINITDLSLKEYSYELDFDPNQNLNGNVEFKATGYHAIAPKKLYFNNKQDYINSYANTYSSIDFSNFKADTPNPNEAIFNSSFNIEITPDNVGQTTYLDPFLFKFFTENPFKLQERSYPIDFGYKDTYIYKIKINVDDTFDIVEIPETLNLVFPDRSANVMLSSQQQDNQVSIYFKVSFNKAIYEPEYYEALKSIMAKVVDVQVNSLIVLEKKQ